MTKDRNALVVTNWMATTAKFSCNNEACNHWEAEWNFTALGLNFCCIFCRIRICEEFEEFEKTSNLLKEILEFNGVI